MDIVNRKRVWIVYPYGDIIGEQFLEARHIRFGRMLAKNGYDVIYWTANFSHTFKKLRSNGWKDIEVCDHFKIVLVPTTTYEKNISIGRLKFEIKYAKELEKAFQHDEKPDLILTAGTGLVTAFKPVWPYIKNNSIPSIYDIMDVHLFNSYVDTHVKALKPLAVLFTKILEKREEGFYHHVDAICGLGSNQVEIAKKRTGKKEIPSCLVYNSIVIDEFREKMKKPCILSLPEKKDEWIWCVYAGSLGPSYDIESLIQCADKVKANGDKIHFIIAGAGPQQDLVAKAARNNEHITFLGSVDPDQLPSLYKQCDIGLCTYASYSTVDMPDKFYDYAAAGLAMVNSLQGEIKGYVVDGAGVQYKAEDADNLYASIIKTTKDLDCYKEKSYELAQKFDLNELMKPLLDMINQLTR